MIRNILKAAAVILLASLLHEKSFADDELEVPKEELATESVLPIFDNAVSVKNRNIITANRFDTNFFYSYAMTEPIFSVSKLGLSIYYNNSENNAWGLLYAKNFTGLSSYADQLKSQYGLDFSKAPQPQSTLMIDYNAKAFYGKMSVTKSLVVNTSLFGSAALGAVQFQNNTYPALAVGLGQKFYFSKLWSFRFDLRLLANQAPIPFKPLTGPKANDGIYDERITYTTNLDIGLSYLF